MMWLALEDTDIYNGCLEFVKDSHRPANSKTSNFIQSRLIINEKTKNFDVIGTDPIYPNESDFENIPDDMFEPCPVKAGSLILVHGAMVHRSKKNLNQDGKSRNVLVWHVAENNNCTWDKKNWIQVGKKE